MSPRTIRCIVRTTKVLKSVKGESDYRIKKNEGIKSLPILRHSRRQHIQLATSERKKDNFENMTKRNEILGYCEEPLNYCEEEGNLNEHVKVNEV